MPPSVTLKSLLATHDQPFVIIDRSLTIVDINNAYAHLFSLDRKDLIGKPCCASIDKSLTKPQPDCRHQQLFRELEPYAVVLTQTDSDDIAKTWRVRGYPLIDADTGILLGEAVLPAEVSSNPIDETKMVGTSSAFHKLIQRLEQAATVDLPVLLQGETGTGKELAAEHIHKCSRRCDNEFVVVDCTVLGEDLFESELFGHGKGAFTGASNTKKGLYEVADGGTLFLDEIGELPLSQQPKLLRALESGTFRRVGCTESQHSDVRIVSATHRNLLKMVETGDFREDLFYRLSVFPVELPPLRERPEDIPYLAAYLLKQINHSTGRSVRFAPNGLNQLCNHSFPGNIRELRNTLQLAAAICQNGIIDDKIIQFRSDEALHSYPALDDFESPFSLTTDDSSLNPIEHIEANYIFLLMKKHSGNRRNIAYEMGVSERTLYRKLNRYNINNNKIIGTMQ